MEIGEAFYFSSLTMVSMSKDKLSNLMYSFCQIRIPVKDLKISV